MEAPNPLHINTPTGHVPESSVLCKSLDPEHVSELVGRWFDLASFRKSDEKYDNDIESIWGELE